MSKEVISTAESANSRLLLKARSLFFVAVDVSKG